MPLRTVFAETVTYNVAIATVAKYVAIAMLIANQFVMNINFIGNMPIEM